MYALLRKIGLFLFCCLCVTGLRSQLKTYDLDYGWTFLQGQDLKASGSDFNDTGWTKIDLPYDWDSHFPVERINATGRGGGFARGGIGWFRKVFRMPQSLPFQDRVYLEFDGIMRISDVYVNGHLIGRRQNGYVQIYYDITEFLNKKKNEINVIAIRVDNSLQPASRWYSGSGIYRHSRLLFTGPLHFQHNGLWVSVSGISDKKAELKAYVDIEGEEREVGSANILFKVFDPQGNLVDQQKMPLDRENQKDIQLTYLFSLKQPKLWSVGHGLLYRLRCILSDRMGILDSSEVTFGVRTIHFDAKNGFSINDSLMKIKGVCLHQDASAFGTAVPLGVWNMRLDRLLSLGVNALRTSHNQVAPEVLDLCDQKGIVVLDEAFDCWHKGKTSAENGYNLFFDTCWKKDLDDQIQTDRHHPCVILYSVGNEIHDDLNRPEVRTIYMKLQHEAHSQDPTRLVTMALFRPNLSHVYQNGLADSMDIIGQNYRENELVDAHLSRPERIVIGTENGHSLSAWKILRDNPFMCGQFLWTGFDYLGEADWPAVANGQGLFDKTAFPRDIAFQRASWWSSFPVVHLMRREGNAGSGNWVANWTPSDVDTYDQAQIQVYSNCRQVELFLNGHSLGRKMQMEDHASPLSWETNFEKGLLIAVGRDSQDRTVAIDTLRTASEPYAIRLDSAFMVPQSSREFPGAVRAWIVDSSGTVCPRADNRITFTVEGDGVIIATDNGDLSSAEPYQDAHRFCYQGSCVLYFASKHPRGKIIVKASSPGLVSTVRQFSIEPSLLLENPKL